MADPDTTFLAAKFALFGALGASSLSIVGGLLGALITNRTTRRNHIREMALQAAIKSWDHQTWMWEHARQRNQSMTFRPLDGFFLHYMQIAEVLGDGRITPEVLSARLAEIDKLHPIMSEWEERPITRTKQNEESEQDETRNGA